MEQVKKLMEAGASFPDAVRIAVGGSYMQFCDEVGLDRAPFSLMANLRKTPTPQQLEALCQRIGGTPQEWLDLWFNQARASTEIESAAESTSEAA